MKRRHLLTLICSWIALTIHSNQLIAQPSGCGCNADFYYQPVTGNPLQYQFFDYSCYDTSLVPTFFSWDFGDGTTIQQMNPVHTFPGGGGYTICLYLLNGNGAGCCIDTICQDVYIDATSVGSTTRPEWQVMPDYSAGKIRIQFAEALGENTTLLLSDLTGKICRQTFAAKGEKQAEISLPEKTGLYFLHSGSNTVSQKIFIDRN